MSITNRNLIVRTLTGVLFVGVVVGCIVGGANSFRFLFALLTLLSVVEFARIVNLRDGVDVDVLFCFVGAFLLYACTHMFVLSPGLAPFALFYLLYLLMLFVKELYLQREEPFHNIAYTLFSHIYIALPFGLLSILAFRPDWFADVQLPYFDNYSYVLPMSLFLFIWSNDTGAYCCGSLLGKHKLFARISPKKTWEGTIGGCILTIVVACVWGIYHPIFSLYTWAGWAVVVVLFGTLGDLFESLLKRHIGLKDSGNILPGHGGLLDRFDSALFAIPASVIYLYLMHMWGL